MSPINPVMVQRRAVEIGRLRLGQQLVSKRGKRYPSKLDRFRFTTRSRHAADAVAALLGGQVSAWEDAPGGGQWQVFTEATELDVAVPPGDQAVSQFMELWSGGGCVRRCDGVTETRQNVPCLCPSDHLRRQELAQRGEACKPTTRVSVILPDLPGIGLWRLESHGYYAAVELGGVAETLAGARAAGVIVPAVLRIEQRRVVSGGQTKDFPVPVLEVRRTLRELTQLEAGRASLVESLPPPPPRAALGAAQRPVTGAQPAVGAGQQQQPAGPTVAPPADAQECAERAAGADEAMLGRLGAWARRRGWLDTFVEVDGVHTALVEVLAGRDSELRASRDRQAAAEEQPAPQQPEQPEQPAEPEAPAEQPTEQPTEQPAEPEEQPEEEYTPPDPTTGDEPRVSPEAEPVAGKAVDW